MIFRDPELIKIGMTVLYSDGTEFKITTEKQLKKVQEEYWEYEPFVKPKKK